MISSRLAALFLVAAPAFAQVDPNAPGSVWRAGKPRPRPDFDIRFSDSALPAARMDERDPGARTRAAQADEHALRARIPQLRIDRESLFGTPRWIASTARFLTEPVAGDLFDAVAVTRAFVAAHGSLLEIAPEELDRSRRARDYRTQHNGIRHLTFQQQIGGIDLLGAELRANVTRHGELMNVSSTMLPRPEGDFAPSPVVLTPLRAIQEAARSIGVEVGADPASSFRTDLPVTTELAYFPLARDEIRAAWKVFLPEIGVGNDYEIVVDATDGRILARRNFLQFAVGGTQNLSLNVYTSDSPAPGSPGNSTPNGHQFPFVPRRFATITPASVPQSPNSWIDDGDNDTQGNNVDAHLDLDADDVPDLPRPRGVPFRVFDFPQDNALPPSAWRDAAVTNLFYSCNRYHDRLYALGFDEAAGNFQTDNFGLGGVGNDRVEADAQDGGGLNNANFSTFADGVSGRMQQYVFSNPTPDRDSDLDADIVYHEFSHGLSNRLHNLQVAGVQAGGMGEGWGDYFGVSLNAEASDDPNAVYCLGAYSVYGLAAGFVDNYYFGIRRFPFSTDLGKNPTTYADIDPAQQSYPPGVPRSTVFANTANEVHNVGEIWCNMLLEVRANLWATYGFAANDRLMQLVVDGMKLDPATPNFLQARDAIVQADLASAGGADLADIWKAFAKRGCGASATSPPGNTSNGVVEAFDLPIVYTYPAGVPAQLLPNQATTFQVEIAGAGSLQPVAGSGQLFLSVDGGPFSAVAMSQTAPNRYDATLPASPCFTELRFYVRTDTTAGPSTDPSNAPAATYAGAVYTGVATLFDDDFETNLGWTTSIQGATSGAWERGVPVDDPSWAYDPATDGDGNPAGRCYLTMNSNGNTDVDGGAVTLTSPNFDMTGGAGISYAYYLDLTDASGADRLLVEMNSNGGAGPWTTIATHTTSGDTNWRQHSISASRLSSLGIAFTSTMRVRFTANDADPQSIVEAGVDSVLVGRLACTPTLGTNYCFGDGSVTPCPCGNDGNAGRGCDSSAATGGSLLWATGTTSPDRVVFTTTGETPTAFTLFVQGDATGVPVNFGDGLRCVRGNLKRLYAKHATGGRATAPEAGDPSVTARSAALGDPIVPGTTRYYFVSYRDPDAAFCPPPTGSTFNATNAFSILW
ncbi:MAG TPA: M36 family metallopeptidase [Planctomycetota bacterium]|jgi:hypothetical protein|nr:M36 family metallopeptidase [Planctomycetota bacterium]